MEILIKNKALETVLEDIGEAFRALCPDDYERFIAAVKRESEMLLKPSGMSQEGTMINLMKIPIATNSRGEKKSLYTFIKWQVQQSCGIDDFFRDRKNYQLLCRVWADAHVRKHKREIISRSGSASPPASEEKCPSPQSQKESPSAS